MEDGVLEIKDLVNREKEEEKQRFDAKEIEEEEQISSGGVISNFISALVTKDCDEEERKQEEEEKEGGIISHLISNLVSPLSPKVMKEDNVSGLEEGKKGGGVFDNLISGILHQSGGEKDEGKHEKVETEEANESKGLIDNIVSHLPTPLADDAAPATEEASILIHSIVHD